MERVVGGEECRCLEMRLRREFAELDVIAGQCARGRPMPRSALREDASRVCAVDVVGTSASLLNDEML